MNEVLIGPAGGAGGNSFEPCSIPAGGRIKEIHVFADQYVNAIQLTYVDPAGSQTVLPKLGGEGGIHHVFTLDDDEYIAAISGLCDWYIDQIRFHTNKRSSDCYGTGATEQAFRLEAPEGYSIVGLFGRCDWYIDSVGAISRSNAAPVVEPEPVPSTRTPRPKDLEKVEGIGPKIAALLVAQGINDLSDLAQTPVERLREILKAAGSRYAIADPTTWPEQATLGAKGDWEGMTALQKKLTAGRRG